MYHGPAVHIGIQQIPRHRIKRRAKVLECPQARPKHAAVVPEKVGLGRNALLVRLFFTFDAIKNAFSVQVVPWIRGFIEGLNTACDRSVHGEDMGCALTWNWIILKSADHDAA